MSLIRNELIRVCALEIKGMSLEAISAQIMKTMGDNPMLLSGISMEASDWVCESFNSLNLGYPPIDFPDVHLEDVHYETNRSIPSKTGAAHREQNIKINPKGAAWRAKEIMIEERLSISLTDLHEQLIKEGYKYSIHTLQVVATEFRNCVKFLDKKGYLISRAIRE